MSKLMVAYITCDDDDVDSIREVLDEDVKAVAEYVSVSVEDVQEGTATGPTTKTTLSELITQLQAIAYEHGGSIEVKATDSDGCIAAPVVQPPTQFTPWLSIGG